MDNTLTKLEREYCPPIDSALFSAIVSDFDLKSSESVVAAREILDAIAASALEQDSTEFDPSGSALHAVGAEHDGGVDTRDASSETEASLSQETDLTSISNGLRSVKLDSETNADRVQWDEEEKLDDASKKALLREMFPESNEFAISHTLAKCRGNWNRALEELLNHTFLNNGAASSDGEDIISAKGIEAFSEDHIVRRGRKKKNKLKGRKFDEGLAARSNSLPRPAQVSPWDKAQRDVKFLESRTNSPKTTLSALYHQNGASLVATTQALIDSAQTTEATDANADPVMQIHAQELAKDFPTLNQDQLTGLIRLTHPSTAAAHELAKALTTPEASKSSSSHGISVIPRYAPLAIDIADSSIDTNSRQSPRSGRTPRSSGASTPTTGADSTALATTYLAAQQRSFTQAAAAYRRGKSDHLISGAASYYSQQGREFAAKRAEATAEAADALVAGQSTRQVVDLHGVGVKDAVRISRDLVQAWWRERGRKVRGVDGRWKVEDGDGRAEGGSEALRIVTGVGRHSTGGVGKLGPAVGRMLVVEGWSFTAAEGVLTVYGKRA